MNTMFLTHTNPGLAKYQCHPIGAGDSRAINRMLLDIEAVDQRKIIDTMEDRQRDLNDPDTDPTTDSIVLLTPEGQAAAMGWIFTPSEAATEYVSFLWGEVHPEHRQRGLGDFVLSWMEQRATQILSSMPPDRPHTMRAFIKHGLRDRKELFEKHGFRIVRSFYRMRRDLNQPIDQPELPAACILTGWDSKRESEALDVMNQAFRDHWGFIPLTWANWQLWVTDHEDFRPDLSFMILSAETGKIVGMAVNKVHRAENAALGIREGWTMDLCVLRPWRKRGLASAMLNASMHAFKMDGLETAGLGVDTENLTGALRLYERLGFQSVMRNHTFAKTV